MSAAATGTPRRTRSALMTAVLSTSVAGTTDPASPASTPDATGAGTTGSTRYTTSPTGSPTNTRFPADPTHTALPACTPGSS